MAGLIYDHRMSNRVSKIKAAKEAVVIPLLGNKRQNDLKREKVTLEERLTSFEEVEEKRKTLQRELNATQEKLETLRSGDNPDALVSISGSNIGRDLSVEKINVGFSEEYIEKRVQEIREEMERTQLLERERDSVSAQYEAVQHKLVSLNETMRRQRQKWIASFGAVLVLGATTYAGLSFLGGNADDDRLRDARTVPDKAELVAERVVIPPTEAEIRARFAEAVDVVHRLTLLEGGKVLDVTLAQGDEGFSVDMAPEIVTSLRFVAMAQGAAQLCIQYDSQKEALVFSGPQIDEGQAAFGIEVDDTATMPLAPVCTQISMRWTAMPPQTPRRHDVPVYRAPHATKDDTPVGRLSNSEAYPAWRDAQCEWIRLEIEGNFFFGKCSEFEPGAL